MTHFPDPSPASVTASPALHDRVSAQQRRGFWLRQLHQWHWISSAVCLVGMLLFTATGITLNHAARIEAQPRVDNRTAQLPVPLLSPEASTNHSGSLRKLNVPSEFQVVSETLLGEKMRSAWAPGMAAD